MGPGQGFPVEISVPRDRDSSFEPKIVAKRQRRLTGVDEMVISLSAKGLTHGEIAAHLANSQLPLNHVAFEAPVDIAAWHDKPTFYVISTKDKVLAPEAQKSFAARIHAQTTEVAGSHASLVVHAKQVAEVIEKAALAK